MVQIFSLMLRYYCYYFVLSGSSVVTEYFYNGKCAGTPASFSETFTQYCSVPNHINIFLNNIRELSAYGYLYNGFYTATPSPSVSPTFVLTSPTTTPTLAPTPITSYAVVYYYSGSNCNGTLIAGEAIGLNTCYPSGHGLNSTIAVVSGNVLTVTIYLSTDCSGHVLKTTTVPTTCSSFSDKDFTGTQIFYTTTTSLTWPSAGTVTRSVLNHVHTYI
jgi:hypothetical protein